MDVSEAAEEYFASIKRLETGTRQGYEQRLGVFADWCTERSVCLEQVSRRIVDSFVEHLRATHSSHTGAQLSSYTTAGYVRCIRALLFWCSEDEQFESYVKLAAIKRIKLPKLTQKIIAVFTQEHIDALLKATAREYNDYLQERDRVIIRVLLCTGIRAAELCTLKIADCHTRPNTLKNPDDAYIKVFGKGRKEREVPLDEQPRRLVKKYLRQFRAGARPDTTVFVDRTEQLPLGKDALQGIFERLGRWAEISGVRCSPHTCRHYFAAHFWQKHRDIYALSRILGHASVNVTEHYLRSVSSVDVRIALQRVK